MKKLLFLKCTVFFFVAVSDISFGKTALAWDKIYDDAKKVLSSFPTITQINNSQLAVKSKQWMLDTRKTIAVIVENKAQPNRQVVRQLFSKVGSLPKVSRIIF